MLQALESRAHGLRIEFAILPRLKSGLAVSVLTTRFGFYPTQGGRAEVLHSRTHRADPCPPSAGPVLQPTLFILVPGNYLPPPCGYCVVCWTLLPIPIDRPLLAVRWPSLL